MDKFKAISSYLQHSVESYDEDGIYRYSSKHEQSEEMLFLTVWVHEYVLLAGLLVVAGIRTFAELSSGALLKKVQKVVGEEQIKEIQSHFNAMESDIDKLYIDRNEVKRIKKEFGELPFLDIKTDFSIPGSKAVIDGNTRKKNKKNLKEMVKQIISSASGLKDKKFLTKKALVGDSTPICTFHFNTNELNKWTMGEKGKAQAYYNNIETYKQYDIKINNFLKRYNVSKGAISRVVTYRKLKEKSENYCVESQIMINVEDSKLKSILAPIAAALDKM